jgi:hypothetical protein
MGNEPARPPKTRSRRSKCSVPANNLTWPFWICKCPAWTASRWPRKSASCPGGDDAAGAAHAAGHARRLRARHAHFTFAHSITKPVKPRNFAPRSNARCSARKKPPRRPPPPKPINRSPNGCRCAFFCATTTPSIKKSPRAFCNRSATSPTSPATDAKRLRRSTKNPALRFGFHGRDDAGNGRLEATRAIRERQKDRRHNRITSRASSSSP